MNVGQQPINSNKLRPTLDYAGRRIEYETVTLIRKKRQKIAKDKDILRLCLGIDQAIQALNSQILRETNIESLQKLLDDRTFLKRKKRNLFLLF